MKIYTQSELQSIQKDVFFFITEGENLKEGIKGIAKIRYPEGSIYTGPVEFTGSSFEKIGYGQQDFTFSTITCDSVGGPSGDTLYLYEGMYDYKVTQWIYGDGVFYFLKDGKPDCYFAGNFAGISYVRDYQGKDLHNLILPTFRNTRRLRGLHPNEKRISDMIEHSKTMKDVDYMFVGDSYFDFLNNHCTCDGSTLFDYYSKGNGTVNYGIGGFRFCDFNPFVSKLVINCSPKNIIVNLGFNDIHSGKSVEETLNDCRTFLNSINSVTENIRIYLLGVCHFPLFPAFREKEDRYNELIDLVAKEYKNVSIIHAENVFEEISKKGEDFSSYIESDLIHPNNKGYSVWMPAILKNVKGYKL